MSCQKIVFIGPVGSGKTTAIHSVSNIKPVTTETPLKEVSLPGKSSTTVALDYGIINTSSNHRLHLYGTPGQQRFDFMWEILLQGESLGAVLLINNDAPQPLQDMVFFLETFKLAAKNIPFVIAVTRMDIKPEPNVMKYKQKLAEMSLEATSVTNIDSRKRHDVLKILNLLITASASSIRL